MIRQGEWWRLLTAGFLHGGLFHILMNSWVLFDLGAQVEEIYGTSRYLVFYFIATVTGFLASAVFSGALSIGASAGIFGLIGAMIGFVMMSVAMSVVDSSVATIFVCYALEPQQLALHDKELKARFDTAYNAAEHQGVQVH